MQKQVWGFQSSVQSKRTSWTKCTWQWNLSPIWCIPFSCCRALIDSKDIQEPLVFLSEVGSLVLSTFHDKEASLAENLHHLEPHCLQRVRKARLNWCCWLPINEWAADAHMINSKNRVEYDQQSAGPDMQMRWMLALSNFDEGKYHLTWLMGLGDWFFLSKWLFCDQTGHNDFKH